MKGFDILEFDGREILLIPHMERAFRFYRKAESPYITIRGLSGHPLAYSNGSVALHRYILFEHLGRPEESGCHWCEYPLPWRGENDPEFAGCTKCVNVDHVDGDPTNNEVSNLVPSCWWCNTGRGWAKFYPELWEKWFQFMRSHPPQNRISMREIAEEEGYPNPYSADGKFKQYA